MLERPISTGSRKIVGERRKIFNHRHRVRRAHAVA